MPRALGWLVATVALVACGYQTLGVHPRPLTVDAVLTADPDPVLASMARAAVLEALAREGVTPGGPSHVDVTVSSPPNTAPAASFASEVRAEITLRARVSEAGRVRWIEARGEAEAPAGGSAYTASEALRLARRRACELAAMRLAEALRTASD